MDSKERDLDNPDFELPLDENGKLDVDEWLGQEFLFQNSHGAAVQRWLPRAVPAVRPQNGGMCMPAGRAGRRARRPKARDLSNHC